MRWARVSYGGIPRTTALWACCSLLSCLACTQPYYLIEDPPPPVALHRIAMLPMNFEFTPPNTWVDGLERLSQQLRSTLEQGGHRVEPVPLRTTLRDWRDVVRNQGGLRNEQGLVDPQRYRTAREDLARMVLEESGADAVLMATVLIRQAEIDRRKVRWDGVTADLRIEYGEKYLDRYWGAGTIDAASLRVTLYGREGEMIFERLEGLEPLQWIYIDKDQFSVRDRTDLFEDRERLRDAVETALAPYLPALDPQ